MREWSDEAFFGYAAGFLDGEGCIEINKTECGIRLRFANTHYDSLDAMHQRFECGRIEEYARRKENGHKRLFCFTASNAPDVEYILIRLLPYLLIKKERAEYALAIIQRQRQRMEDLDARNAEIVSRVNAGERQKDVAANFGISQQLVSRIVNAHKWPCNTVAFNARRNLKKGVRSSDQVFRLHGSPHP